MRPTIHRITTSQFEQSPATLLFDHENSCCFGVIHRANHSFRFSWESKLVEPEVLSDDKGICGVGIDLWYAIFNIYSGEVLKRIELDTFFARAILANNEMFIFCEIEALRLRYPEFEEVERYSFPDIFESVDGAEDRFTVECMDGSEVVIML